MNTTLFEGELPECMILVVRGKQFHGYFWPKNFQRIGSKEKIDEIALNPDTMRRPPKIVLSTLAHEMCHLWQYSFGTPGRGRYHNKEWAEKMETIGLMPTSTGAPGGKRTGDHMTHFIIPEDPYEVLL